MVILVASCDKNQDLWYPFYYCMEKYWPEHPEIFYSTETLKNPYYKTFSFNYKIEQWTHRIRETITQINDDFILLMVDDVFLQKSTDDTKVLNLVNFFNDDIAAINLEPSFDSHDKPYSNDLMERSINGKYKTSLMCSLWRKDKLLKVLDYDTDPWQFEWDNKHHDYQYLITKKGGFLHWGFKDGNDNWRFGLHEGKWFRETKRFFDKEGLKINYSIRGFKN